jgi:hypothetical protein
MSNLIPKQSSLIDFNYQHLGFNDVKFATNPAITKTTSQFGGKYLVGAESSTLKALLPEDMYNKCRLFSFNNKNYLINFLCVIIIILLIIIVFMHIKEHNKEYYKYHHNNHVPIWYHDNFKNKTNYKNNPQKLDEKRILIKQLPLIKSINSTKHSNFVEQNSIKPQIKLLENKTTSNKTISNKIPDNV